MSNKENDPGYSTSIVDLCTLSLINETNIQGIAEKLGVMLGRPILIEDKFFRTLGKSSIVTDSLAFPKPQLNDSYIKEYVAKSQNEKASVIMPPLPQYGVRQSRIIFPILTGDVIHGYLHVFDKRNPPFLTGQEKKSVITVLMALAIKTIKEEAEMQAREAIIGSLYHKLVFQEYYTDKVIQETALLLNLDLSIPSWLMIAQIDGPISNADKLKALKSLLKEKEVDAKVFCLQRELFFIFIAESKQVYKKVAIMSLAHQLIENLQNCYPESVSYITLGRKCLKPGDYYKSYYEALKALDYLKESSPKSQVLSFDSLGIIGSITLPEEVEHLLSFSQKTLKPLLEYDEQNPTIKLVQTLAYFLKNNTQIKQTAKDLYIHVNTLRYRLEKIVEIGQFDLDNAEVKFQLFLALKILNLKEALAHSAKPHRLFEY